MAYTDEGPRHCVGILTPCEPFTLSECLRSSDEKRRGSDIVENVSGRDWPIASVVIPAHNEGSAIGLSLTALLADATPGEFEVAIVANGCTDDTAERARRAAEANGYPARVVDLEVASKTAALNAGDDLVEAFPRLYLDADVLCPTATARAMAVVARECELVVPSRRLDLRGASWTARHYYDTWLELPRVTSAMSGRGAYMLSAAGRRRFERFPDVVADDYWAVHQVPAEAACIVGEAVTARPPSTALDVLRVRTRVYAANSAVDVETHGQTYSVWDDLRAVSSSPAQWPGVAIYSVLTGTAKVRGKISRRQSLAAHRDHSRGVVS